MKQKKIIILVLIAALLSVSLIGCDRSIKIDFDETAAVGNHEDLEQEDNTVYKKYDNLKRIESFSNGLAAFLIYESSGTYHWGTSGSWNGDYYYGYIDIKGNVIVDPIYECNPNKAIPQFGEKYVRVADLDDNEYIIDRKGKVQFQVGQNNVTAIGNVSNGYFWIETAEEDLSGKMYTVRYYSANDLSVVATFNNARATHEDMTTSLPYRATLSDEGLGCLIMGSDHSYYDDEIIYVDISEYDSNFIPKTDNWDVDLNDIENFSEASYRYGYVSSDKNTLGQIGTVVLVNSSGTQFYAIIDNRGNVLMKPQINITFPIDTGWGASPSSDLKKYDFCKDLCPAKDADSEMWGYIDPYGNWKIQPQYSSVTPFSSDGYATVNDKIIINTDGEVVLSPSEWTNEQIASLSGRYKYTGTASWDYYMDFDEDGRITITESFSGGSSRTNGTYSIKGATIVFSGLGSYNFYPGIKGDGSYPFYKDGDDLVINGEKWAPVS